MINSDQMTAAVLAHGILEFVALTAMYPNDILKEVRETIEGFKVGCTEPKELSFIDSAISLIDHNLGEVEQFNKEVRDMKK